MILIQDKPVPVRIETDTIELDQFLKWANVVRSGGEAKYLITSGKVRLNGEQETRRGRKLIPGDRIKIESGSEFVVTGSE